MTIQTKAVQRTWLMQDPPPPPSLSALVIEHDMQVTTR